MGCMAARRPMHIWPSGLRGEDTINPCWNTESWMQNDPFSWLNTAVLKIVTDGWWGGVWWTLLFNLHGIPVGSPWSITSPSVSLGIPVPTDPLVLGLTLFKKHFPLCPLPVTPEHIKGSKKSHNLICLTLTWYFSFLGYVNIQSSDVGAERVAVSIRRTIVISCAICHSPCPLPPLPK